MKDIKKSIQKKRATAIEKQQLNKFYFDRIVNKENVELYQLNLLYTIYADKYNINHKKNNQLKELSCDLDFNVENLLIENIKKKEESVKFQVMLIKFLNSELE